MKSISLAVSFLLLSFAFARAEYEPVDVGSVRDKITVRVGQKVAFVFDRRGDRLVNPRPAAEGTKEPVFTAWLMEWKGHNILRVGSTFPKLLRYHSAARGPRSHGFRRVNRMFGVLPGKLVEEMFDLPISEFALYDFTLRNERTDQLSTNETVGW